MIRRLRERRRFIVYVAGGLLSAAADTGALAALLACGMPTLPAATLAFATGMAINYQWHARVTFGQLDKAGGFLRYLCVVALNYITTIAIVAVFDHVFGAPVIGKLVSLPVIAAVGYTLGKLWIFKPSENA